MPWIEYHIAISADYSDQLSDELTELGAQALTFYDAGDEPIYEPAFDKAPPVWQEVILVALFDSEEDPAPVIDYLQKQQTQSQLKSFTTKKVEDEDWERRCLEHFKPICFGKRLWICPSWETPPDANAVNIILDPGLAFGTGTHPTTALCLEWLDANFKEGSRTIDYGSGSGILALAACKLGASKVTAIDHDPQALIATEENARRNHIPQNQIETFFPEQFQPVEADLLIANILTNPLIQLAPLFAKLVKKDGNIVLSGILIDQIEQIQAAYAPYFILEVPVFKQDWVRFVGLRK